VVYKVVVVCSRSKLEPLETWLPGRVLWCFVENTTGGSWYRCSALKGKKIEMKKEEWGSRSKDRRKKCLAGRTRALYRAVKERETGNRKEISVKDGSRCLLMFGGSVSAHLANSYSLFQSGDAGRLECFSAAGTHSQRAPATAPVLAFVVCVADCAFDWSVGVARW
jgi:hypothetical protein